MSEDSVRERTCVAAVRCNVIVRKNDKTGGDHHQELYDTGGVTRLKRCQDTKERHDS